MEPSVSMLIVEDDGVTREVLGAIIARKFPDIPIYFAENGRRGLEVFEEHTPEIVITDINMPEMDGIEMAAKIKSIKADTKFIVVTAYGTTGFYEKFSRIGFSEFLSKPIEFKRLFDAVEKCTAEITRERQ